MNTV
jgi:hypothetical protein